MPRTERFGETLLILVGKSSERVHLVVALERLANIGRDQPKLLESCVARASPQSYPGARDRCRTSSDPSVSNRGFSILPEKEHVSVSPNTLFARRRDDDPSVGHHQKLARYPFRFPRLLVRHGATLHPSQESALKGVSFTQ